MKTILFLILLILLVPIVLGGGYMEYASVGYVNTNFCMINGVCTFDTLIVYNISVIGEVFNVTMNLVTWNITESFNVGGNLEAKNGTFDYVEGDGSGLTNLNHSLQDAYDDGSVIGVITFDSSTGEINGSFSAEDIDRDLPTDCPAGNAVYGLGDNASTWFCRDSWVNIDGDTMTGGLVVPNITSDDDTIEVYSNVDIIDKNFTVDTDTLVVDAGNHWVKITASTKESGAAAFRFYDSDNVLRSYIKDNGPQVWRLHSGSAESGSIEYSTPDGSPGIVMWTGSPGSYTNRWQMVNKGSYMNLYYQDDGAGYGLILHKAAGAKLVSPATSLRLHSKVDNPVNGGSLIFEEGAGASGSNDMFTITYDGSDNKLKIHSKEVSNIMVFPRTTGNVGIGTATPSHKLEVAGSMNVSYLNVSEDLNIFGNSYFGGGYGNTGATIYDNGDISMDGDLTVSGLNSTFDNDVVILGTLHGGSPVKIAGVNISDNLFMLEENRNSSSRFTLENLNSGENATAVITAKNDVGGTMSIGIGSSNFMIGNKNYQNITALLSKSRGDMVFANFYNKPFVWLTNPSDDNDANNLVEIMRLDEKGLNVSGNFTANFIYAEMWGKDVGEVVLTDAGQYVNFTTFNNTKLNGFTYSSGKLTAVVGGIYSINSQFAFSGSANQEYHLAFGVNGEKVPNCHTARVIGTGGDVGSASITCLCPMEAGDVSTAMIENIDSAGNPTVYDININLMRIGN